MLILTRKPGESIIVEESVRITVLEVRGSQVKLGIQAPQEVRVNREEVLERQRAESNLPPLDTLPALASPPRASARPSGTRSGVRSPHRSTSERGDGDREPGMRRRAADRHPRSDSGSARDGHRSPRQQASPREQSPSRPASPGAAGPPIIQRHGPSRPLPPPRLHDEDLDETSPPAGTMRRYRLPEGRQPFGRRWTTSRPVPPTNPEEVDRHGIDPGAEPMARTEDAAPESGQAPANPPPIDDQASSSRPRRRAGGEAA